MGPAVFLGFISEWSLAIGTVLVVVAVLIDSAGAEFSIAVGAFKMAAVLVDSRGVELLGVMFARCVDIAGRASLSAVPLVVSHVDTTLVVDSVDGGSSEALGIGMLAA